MDFDLLMKEEIKSHLWSVILAGGDGERLRPFIQRALGYGKPKQYCTFVGTRSLFQHTLDRADLLSRPDRKVTVITESHCGEALPQLAGHQAGTLLFQPANRDTAAGVFLALTHVRARDPEATVVIYPSDHFVYPEDNFVGVVQRAVRAAKHLKDMVFLLAVPPDSPEEQYGWIQVGPNLGRVDGSPERAVKTFVEKPSSQVRKEMMACGALWNTLVLAAKVETLWALGWRCFPEIMWLFEIYGETIGTSEEGGVLEALYKEMPSRNFSSHLLACVSKQIGVFELTGVLWRTGESPNESWIHLAAARKYRDFRRSNSNTRVFRSNVGQ